MRPAEQLSLWWLVQALREQIVPSARAYPLEALMADCQEYFRCVCVWGGGGGAGWKARLPACQADERRTGAAQRPPPPLDR
jgi:hypothetical protein